MPVLLEYGTNDFARKHVYNDLEPYICLFSDCDLGLHTFQSRRDWKDHEFKAHRMKLEWHCNLCQERFDTQELFREHIDESHGNDIAMSQVEEYISASRRRMACKVEYEVCPFCLTAPSQTQDGFASHVGKHQQDISLAALLRLDDYSDDEESINDDKDSDDGDDGDDSSNGDYDRKIADIEIIRTQTENDLAPTKLTAFERLPDSVIDR